MVRMATINDIDSIVELRIRLLNEVNKNVENYNLVEYSQVLKAFYYDSLPNENVIAFVVEEYGKIVAMSMMCFYHITPLLNNIDGKMALLTDMYTIPAYRNMGFGTSLLASIMGHAKNLGYVKVILNASPSGRKLYKKYGFKDVEGEMFYKFV